MRSTGSRLAWAIGPSPWVVSAMAKAATAATVSIAGSSRSRKAANSTTGASRNSSGFAPCANTSAASPAANSGISTASSGRCSTITWRSGRTASRIGETISSPRTSAPYQLANPSVKGSPSRAMNHVALISDGASGPSIAAPMKRPIEWLSNRRSGWSPLAVIVTTSEISSALSSDSKTASRRLSPTARLASTLPAKPASSSIDHSCCGRRSSRATARPLASQTAAIRPLARVIKMPSSATTNIVAAMARQRHSRPTLA